MSLTDHIWAHISRPHKTTGQLCLHDEASNWLQIYDLGAHLFCLFLLVLPLGSLLLGFAHNLLRRLLPLVHLPVGVGCSVQGLGVWVLILGFGVWGLVFNAQGAKWNAKVSRLEGSIHIQGSTLNLFFGGAQSTYCSLAWLKTINGCIFVPPPITLTCTAINHSHLGGSQRIHCFFVRTVTTEERRYTLLPLKMPTAWHGFLIIYRRI